LVLVLAACGGDDDDDDAAADVTTAAPSATTGGTTETTASETPSSEAGQQEDVTVAIGETALGDTLVDGAGKTLYLFQNDTEGTSNCNDACAEAWPALTIDGDPVPGDGIDSGDLSVITRADGSTQVAYYGHPLYYFAADQAAGDTNGQGIGEVWYAVAPDGNPITGAAAEEEASTVPAGVSPGY
jgi:predicted lipoprotein with Yx(FWY)xxD motif